MPKKHFGKRVWETGILILLLGVIGAGLGVLQRQSRKDAGQQPGLSAAQPTVGLTDAASSGTTVRTDATERRLPRLVDLGAGQCIPCKMMAPILESLAREFEGKLIVEVIDVWEDRQAAARYGIRVIPTQIFYDRSGKEVFRHEGFMSREEIVSQWKALGIDLKNPAP